MLDKPAGLLCVPGRGAEKQDCLSARAQALYPGALIVHRLDMATSGLVVMARSLAVQRSLSAAFAERAVHKRYVAVVACVMPAAPDGDGWQTITLPIMPDWPRRPLQKVDLEHGKPSTTRWRLAPLGVVNGDVDVNADVDAQANLASCRTPHTRVALEPVTGRTHQLRVHLAAIGHPILGDALYAPPAVANCVQRLMLHAASLQLEHPASGEAMAFQSRPPF